MDAWWPKLLEAEFKPALGRRPTKRWKGCSKRAAYTGGSPTGPSFDDGWFSYVSKDLRDVFGPTPKAPWSRVYCGDGSKTQVRRCSKRASGEALKVTPAQLYGGGDGACAANPQPSCFDPNRPEETGGIDSARSRSRTARPSSRSSP